MASPDVAVPQVNGLSASPHPGSPQSINSSTKRKRDVSDDGSAAEENVTDEAKPAVNGNHLHRDQKTLIRNYLEVVKRYDVNPSILKRPIPEPANAEEPEAKRQKSDDGTKPLSIEDKVLQDEYEVLDDVFLDIRAVVKDRIAELQSSSSNESVKDSDAAIVDTNKFRDKAHELYRRESAYPKSIVEPSLSASGDVGDALHPSSTGSVVLTVYGNAPQPKHLFSSLQKRTATPDHPEGVTRPLPPVALPNGITTTVVVPSDSLPKGGRTLTLGELFPAPRNLPPLQPPKAPKSTTKSNILGFYHPELMVKPKYRSDTYYSQNISTGHWLDYSNATPSSQNKTKQRERAQSLAGHKPSSDELEMSEMEALFRGAFSSFAPSKDDSAAIVPSGQLGRMWWQRFGQRSFQRMIELETPESELEEPKDADAVTPLPIDEDLIQNAIEEWDPSVVDPGLEEVMGKKTAHESDVDELLQEVSDLIETLSSYQRNRNLTLPTSQNRYSADPVNGDMLANGTLAQQPSEEEIATYDILKAQLALIIKQLPPYAVARLNSDKLEDLNVSTKIEIRTDEYKGVMEEDEPAARARQQQQAVMQTAATPRPTAQRTGSISSPGQYTNQFGRQYPMHSHSPVPVPQQYYPQTPARPPAGNNFQRPVAGAMPGAQSQPRAPMPQGYRPPNGYPAATYAQQLGKPQTPYGNNMPQYQAAQSQQRIAQHPGYGGAATPGTPGQRYTPGYPSYAPQQTPQGVPPQRQPGYPQYANGAMPSRTMSPQVGAQHPAAYGQSPQPHTQLNRTPSFSTPSQQGGAPDSGRRYSSHSSQGGTQGAQISGYHTVMSDAQHQRSVENARLQAQAHQQATQSQAQTQAQAIARQMQHNQNLGEKITHHTVSGLAGIGLGGPNVDIAKLAAQRAGMPGGLSQSSPSPRPQIPTGGSTPGVNGAAPSVASPASIPASSVSPAPSAGLPRPPA